MRLRNCISDPACFNKLCGVEEENDIRTKGLDWHLQGISPDMSARDYVQSKIRTEVEDTELRQSRH